MSAPMAYPAQYSGKKGQLYVKLAEQVLEWSPGHDEPPSIRIAIGDISNVQASMPTAAKSKLRVITGAQALTFELPTRETLESLKTALSAEKRATTATPGTTPSVPASAASTTPAVSGSSTPGGTPGPVLPEKRGTMSDAELLADVELQQSLLKANAELKQAFLDAVVAQRLPNDEFWRTRIPLLRMHALILGQRRGPYNVLSTIKPTTQADNQIKVSLSAEKIKDIFQQYPVVRQAYNDNVPPMSEATFWSKFFLSKLCRKLRGEKIAVTDAAEPALDKYLDLDEEGRPLADLDAPADARVLRFVDLEANEEQSSTRAGNQPDLTMRPTTQKDALAMIRTMNKLSQRIVLNVAAENDQAPDAIEELKQRELELTDLRDDVRDAPIELKLSVTERLFTNATATASATANGASAASAADAASVSAALTDMVASVGQPALHTLAKAVHGDLMPAQQQVFSLIHNAADNDTAAEDDGLVPSMAARDLKLSHTTAVEFLRHFYSAFFSGDPAKAPAVLPTLAASVAKSRLRLDTIIDNAVAPLVHDNPTVATSAAKRMKYMVSHTAAASAQATALYEAAVKEQTAALAAAQARGAAF
ncbi:uncharacterized protein V1510DRAFT_404497 [Dipodascopsis tothii]|uniref:uncharacterized protein n=1 Tax=Dipodascopsis tothii TaxID=44089 RepID=UPI0034CD0EC9